MTASDGPSAFGDPSDSPFGGLLAGRQAALIRALTRGDGVPEGIDAFRFSAARTALLRKRAGEVARQWPLLAAAFGPGWTTEFAGWAAAHPSQGSLRDGWDFARSLPVLPALAAPELLIRETIWWYDGSAPPRRRRTPAARGRDGTLVLQVLGRAFILRRPS